MRLRVIDYRSAKPITSPGRLAGKIRHGKAKRVRVAVKHTMVVR
jgi:hypothetical protein